MSAAALRSQIQAELASRFDVSFTLSEARTLDTAPSGIPAIDALTGGIPRGALTEICGPESSGRTTLALSLLAAATRRQEYCALVDTADAFDPARAAAAGVHLPQLLWVRCGSHAENALKAADLLVQAGGFGLILMDLADTPDASARRISLASWFRLRHAVEKTRAALVSVEREILARSCSTLQIQMRRPQSVWSGQRSGTLLQGLDAQAESRKHHQSKTTRFAARCLE